MTALDPLGPLVAGRYEDGVVAVGPGGPPGRQGIIASSDHFDLWRDDDRVCLHHRLRSDQIDDAIGDLLHGELFDPGHLAGADLFERLFTGIVRTSAVDPAEAWERFYRNTLRQLRSVPGASLAGWAPVPAHALSLVPPGPVLEIGCCFGFLSLLLAERGHPVIASDLNPGTTGLLAGMATRLGRPVTALTADGRRLPLGPATVDTVVAVHVLEHLDRDDGEALLVEALRVARHRVVIGVPYEDRPTEPFGHRRTLDDAELRRLGRRPGWRADVHPCHGGWLVLDRIQPSGGSTGRPPSVPPDRRGRPARPGGGPPPWP